MTLAQHERQLKHLLWRGRPLAEIEARIEGTPLSEEEKSALWLCAWSFSDVIAAHRAGCRVPALL